MTETQQRFLRAIAERVPMDQVVELHLFPPIRQGGVETGVAVVAEDPRRPEPNVDPTAGIDTATGTGNVHAADAGGPDVNVAGMTAGANAEPAKNQAAGDDTPSADPATPVASGTLSTAAVESASDDAAGARDAVDAERSPYADDPDDHPAGLEAEAAAETNGSHTNGHAPAARVRLTIHTARYRLTLKGVDRGKWEVDVVAEADAPLDAIDAVIRGVQRRAGEGAEPDRLNAEAFRGALEAPLATLER